MYDAWRTLTDGQGTVIAAAITMLAAVLGVVIGAGLFGRRTSSFEKAVIKSEEIIASHVKHVEEKLAGFEKNINDELASLTQGFGTLRGAAADEASYPADIESPKHNIQSDIVEKPDNWDIFRNNWIRIRNRIEEIASNPNIDGRSRAKYGRVDRRNYGELVSKLKIDGLLDGNSDAFLQAVQLWHSTRSSRFEPPIEAVNRMQALADRVA